MSVWVVPASTLPISSMTPASYRSRSVRVVLPASTCATIPRLSSLCDTRHFLQLDPRGLMDGYERVAHRASLAGERWTTKRESYAAADESTRDLPAPARVPPRLQGLALLRAFSGAHDRAFTLERFREIAALLERADELGDGVEGRPIRRARATRSGRRPTTSPGTSCSRSRSRSCGRSSTAFPWGLRSTSVGPGRHTVTSRRLDMR